MDPRASQEEAGDPWAERVKLGPSLVLSRLLGDPRLVSRHRSELRGSFSGLRGAGLG